MRTLSTLLVLAALSTAAPLELARRDGRRFAAEPVSYDDAGVVVARGGKEERIAWRDLEPASALAARKALVSFEDGAGRLQLSEFAASLGLFPEAIAELEVALALGAVAEAEFEARRKELEEAELLFLATEIDRLLETGAEPEECLAAIRRLKDRYPDHPLHERYAPAVRELVDALAKQAEETRLQAEAASGKAALDERAKKIAALDKKKAQALLEARKLFEAGVEAAEKGQVSRARNRLVEPLGAERRYKEARELLRKIARADPDFQVVTKDGLRKEYDAIEASLIDCYLRVARVLLRERNYKGAAEYVRKILLYDPIHEEALAMAEEIRRNRIQLKLSDITNTKPRVSGG